MKRFFFIAVIALFVFTGVSAAWYVSKLHKNHTAVSHAVTSSSFSADALSEKLNDVAANAKQYASRNHFNTQFCFLIDMSIASGKQRFFVFDMKTNKVLKTGLVTHGCCNQKWLTGRQYGNEAGCGCTSLGKYKIGNPYQGRFGLAYKLHGLDTSNSNAYNRFVVLHSHQCVPEKEVEPYPICQSNGCPTVSPGFLKELSILIDKSSEPVLLWIFD